MERDALRGRVLIEESREAVVVIDEEGRVLAASRRARQSLDGVLEGELLPVDLLRTDAGRTPLVVSYPVGGHTERLVYLSEAGDLAAYEELRSGFTAAVSHELRTPLARLLSLLELAGLPGEDVPALLEQSRREIDQIVELIDEVLFLAELESGTRVVSLGAEPVLPVLHEVAAELEEQAARAGVTLHVEGDEDATAEVRPRMLRVVARNLAENAIRYAGPGANAILSVRRSDGEVVLRVVDDGAGVDQADLARLFERFYRADRVARLARHRARARDREARRHLGRGHGRGARWTRPGARDPLLRSRSARSPFTTLSPDLHHPEAPVPAGRWKTRRMTKNTGTIIENCAAAGPAGPAGGRLRPRRRATTRAARRPPPAAAATCPAGSRRTGPAPSARTRPRRPSASSSRTAACR